MPTRMWPRRLLTGFYWFLALEFVVGAVTKYMPGETFYGPPYSVKFVEWGYPSWARFVVGGLEFISAVLLVIPSRRTRFMGATTLVFVLTGAVTTHIINHDVWFESFAAPTHLIIMGVLALANWPAHWKDLLRPRAAAPVQVASHAS